MQQQQQMNSNAASVNSTHVTTEQIQQCLDENKQLIMLIMENQNLGKFAECAPYQVQLQENLTYLAKIADAQPPGGGAAAGSTQKTTFPTLASQTGVQQGQFVQAPMSSKPQSSPFSSKSPFQLNEPAPMSSQPQPSPFASKSPFQLNEPPLQQQFSQGQRPGPNSNTWQIGYGRNLKQDGDA